MYAVVRTGGKQIKVEEGAETVVEKLDAEVGDSIDLEVLFYSDGKTIVADPEVLESASVTAEVVEHLRGEKVVVFKFKRRKGYKRTKGHRQQLTRVKVTGIKAPKGGPRKAAKPAKQEPAEKPEAKKTPEKKAPKKAEAKAAPVKAEPAKKAEAETEPARCEALKADGERCKNKAKEGSKYCGVHAKKHDG